MFKMSIICQYTSFISRTADRVARFLGLRGVHIAYDDVVYDHVCIMYAN